VTTRNLRDTSASRHPRQLTLLAGTALTVLLVLTGGCQGRREALSEPARILLDSLLAANEAMYTSTDANLGYDRRGCVYRQAVSTLGRDHADRLSIEAAGAVRSRRSRSEWEAVNRRLAGDHQAPTPEFCARIDSLWYTRTITKTPSRP
jgi:hypothetical protein